MSVREIVLLGDPILRERAREVAAFDDELRTLVRDMFDTMVAAEGAGLAAPQIGVGLRVLVADARGDDGPGPIALVNPRVVEVGDEEERASEGCLSIPGVSEVVGRPAHVVVEGFDSRGEPVRIPADGLLSRVLQHEVDHLDGILFPDRLSPLKRRMLLQRYKKSRKESE